MNVPDFGRLDNETVVLCFLTDESQVSGKKALLDHHTIQAAVLLDFVITMIHPEIDLVSDKVVSPPL